MHSFDYTNIIFCISFAFLILDKLLHKIEDSEIPQINKDLADGYKKLDELEKQMTDMRIRFAEITSPGHPINRHRD